jgi:hypothetical protein
MKDYIENDELTYSKRQVAQLDALKLRLEEWYMRLLTVDPNLDDGDNIVLRLEGGRCGYHNDEPLYSIRVRETRDTEAL